MTVLPQHLQYQKGGTICVDLTERPSYATVRICDGADGTIQGHVAARISSINGVLNGAASAGDTSINVTSNVGIGVGATFWLQDDPEEALSRRVSGETVYLRRPLLRAHVNAAVVEGTRVSFTCGANVANTLFWDGRAEWNVVYSDANAATIPTAVECTRYPMTRLCSAQDLFDLEPDLYHVLEADEDLERLLDNAHELVLLEIAKASPDLRARTFTGSVEFKRLTALSAAYLRYCRRPGGEAKERADRYRALFLEYLSGVTQTLPRDADQDKVVESDERFSSRTVRMFRC